MTQIDTVCSCKLCRAECERLPGWFTPDEAIRAMAAGYAPRMSAVSEGGVTALAPSVVGKEGQDLHFVPGGRCTFFQGRRCAIHDSGFKPFECRTGFGCRVVPDDPTEIYAMWREPIATLALERWRAL